MKLPLSWLGDFVRVDLPARELAERLTMSGSLVEQVLNTGSEWQSIVVARVISLERHPNADTLWLAELDLGASRQQVVTGAQNLSVGALVPYIPVGATLPGQDKALEPKLLRGIRSEGMVCSARELGISDEHEGILILDSLLSERGITGEIAGRTLADVLGETVLDLDITPNRPDCLSVYGLAREVSAIMRVPLAPVPAGLQEGSDRAADLAWVRVEDSDLCTRCTARVIEGVTVGPSPAWMVERLQASGMRSINNVVDVTNYVMLELGQPLHAYDLDRLSGNGIVVRRARPDERIRTLDEVDRRLSDEMLVIADENGPIGIAGVMGSAPTEVHPGTTRILLEAATFNARSVRRTSVALGLRSEASSRFEKGLPERLSAVASDRAAALLAALSGGTVARGLIDSGLDQDAAQTIAFPLSEVKRLLGVDWTVERITGNLEALGFSCVPVADHIVDVTVPWWRQDIDQSADLVEEVARVTGYDAIPATMIGGTVPIRPASSHHRWYAVVRSAVLASGLSEGSSPALTAKATIDLLRPDASDEEWLRAIVPNPAAVSLAGAHFEPVRIVNALSPEREYLRPTLLPGLLEALRDNLRAGEERVAFFELDFCCFSRPGAQPLERRTLTMALTGLRRPRCWADAAESFDFFDLKGIVEHMLASLGIRDAHFERADTPLLHPGRSAIVRLNGTDLGHFGELHPHIAERWDLGIQRALVAEFDFEALANNAVEARTFSEYSRQPIAKRDLAVVVDDAVEAGQVVTLIAQSGKERVKRITLFDVYRGEQLPAGKKSLAFALDLQAESHTLSEEEIDKVMGRIQRALQHRLGAQLRA